VIDADAVPVVQVFTLWAVCAVRRRRLVVTWHEVWGKENWRRYLGRFLGPVAALLERWALALPDHILSPSHATAERIRSLVGTRVTVVPNGLDLATVDGVPADDEPFDVVYVGRLNAHKNVDALLRGIAHLQAGGAKVTCRILGTGSDDEALRDLAAELGVEHLVRFDGRVESDAAVIAAMKSARVFASLSEREGFGISVLEALACGRPVVAYDHPDNHARELLSHAVNGYLLMSLEPAEVAAALDWTLRNAATLAPHTAAATRAFDWDVIAARLREVYAR
jgi:glycosyltransferase involved in cell wall biosynthesis